MKQDESYFNIFKPKSGIIFMTHLLVYTNFNAKTVTFHTLERRENN